MKRTVAQYIQVYLKGLSMGACDVIPGVSGGTIAFITGIYEELLSSIKSINFSLISTFKTEGIIAVWNKINGTFLLTLGLGIATSILLLSQLVHYLLQYHPILLWAFFFGLILASILYMKKSVEKYTFSFFFLLCLGAFIVVMISIIPPMTGIASSWFFFISGFIAICAMILPGISGSFILLILGSYSLIIGLVAKRDFFNLDFLAFVIGAILGLILFSRLLLNALRNHHNNMMGILIGFLVGSLYKIWPWKQTLEVFDSENERITSVSELSNNQFESLTAYTPTLSQEHHLMSYQEVNITPQCYEFLNGVSSEWIGAIITAFLGFVILFALEYISTQKKHV